MWLRVSSDNLIRWNREAWTFPKDKVKSPYIGCDMRITGRHQIGDATGHQGISSSKSHNRIESIGKHCKVLLEQSLQIFCAKKSRDIFLSAKAQTSYIPLQRYELDFP